MFFPAADWFAAFALTLVVELPIAVLLLRSVEPQLWRVVVLVVYANLATHLAVWYVFTQLFDVGTVEYTVAAETWAVLAEALFYRVAIRGVTTRRAAVVAIVANGASFAVGRAVGRAWFAT